MIRSAEDRAEIRRSVLYFCLTTLSVFGVYAFDAAGLVIPSARVAWDAGAFTVAFLSTLLAHELGHYFVAAKHGFRTSPPTFIPLPVPGTFGTMGAVIRLRSPPPSRQALLEMGAAGPLCGAVVAFFWLWIGIPWTEAAPAFEPGQVIGVFNDPLIVKIIGVIRLGAPPDRYGTYHPVAMAGWVGCLLTAINLLPIGQLDGGHVLNAIWPTRSVLVGRVLLGACFVGAFFYVGWAVWGVLLVVLRASVPIAVPMSPPLPLRARLVALACAGLLILTFMPVPIEQETFPPASVPDTATP